MYTHKRAFLFTSTCALILCTALTSYAGPNASDFMNGIPTPPEARVSNEQWTAAPQNRWAFQHIRELMPTIEIFRGTGPVYPLQKSLKPVSDVSVRNMDGKPGTIADWLEGSYTDGFLVLHKGEILTEVYKNDMTEHSQHIFFSMYKSLNDQLFM